MTACAFWACMSVLCWLDTQQKTGRFNVQHDIQAPCSMGAADAALAAASDPQW